VRRAFRTDRADVWTGLWVQSELGAGSRFFFTLPVMDDEIVR
jgi:hypothetical protein